MTSDKSDNGRDENLQAFLNSHNGSVSQLFDAIFSFLARSKPELFSASGISLEHIISQSLHKWRTTLKQEELAKTHAAVSSSIQAPLPSLVLDKAKLSNARLPHSCNTPPLRENATDMLAEEIQLERAVIDDSNVTSEEIVQTSNSSSDDTELSQAYSWSQTMEDVDIKVAVPPHIVKGKQLSVGIKDRSMSVAVKGSPEVVLLYGALQHAVNSAESLWDLTPGHHVTLHLSKREAKWWRDNALVGQQGVMEGSTQPERAFNSMNEDEQADIRKIVFDAEQRAAGQPTSDELKVESMLRTAWNAPNSPFQGQEFDLSRVNIVPQGQ